MFSITAAKLQDEFEMGENPCRVTWHNSTCLMPIGYSLPESEHRLIEVVVIGDGYESADDVSIAHLQPKDVFALKSWLEDGYDQYLKVISPEVFADRCEDWLLETMGLTLQKALKVYEKHGITAFMRIDRIVFCLSESVTCIDVTCFGDTYLCDLGFNIDRTATNTWNVSPRLNLMTDIIYPAQEAYDQYDD